MINAAKRIREVEQKKKKVVEMDNVSGKKYNLHN